MFEINIIVTNVTKFYNNYLSSNLFVIYFLIKILTIHSLDERWGVCLGGKR
jgi:hypothetical protein